ncbi:MAG: hypothetical protein MUO17_02510 [Dehalococcoidales bacterium]|nr:hypothetical protein [Dehalococcoidales bacterium]
MEWWQQFLAIVTGALVSGIIGVFIVLLTGRIRNREWVRENVIRPLYNELDWIRVSRTSQIAPGFKSFWSQLDSYSKLKLGENLRNSLANYINVLARVQSAFQHYDKLRWERNYEDCLKRAMTNYLTDDGNSILLEKHALGEKGYHALSIPIKDFLNKYLPVLTQLRDADSLAQTLIAESERHNWEHEKYFRAWQAQRPTVFAELAREFRNIKMPQDYVDAEEELQRVRQELVSTANSLANQLFEQKDERKQYKNSTVEAFGSLSLGLWTVALVGYLTSGISWETYILIALGGLSALFSIYLVLPWDCVYRKQKTVLKYLETKQIIKFAKSLGWLIVLAVFGVRLIQTKVDWLIIAGLIFAIFAYVVFYVSLWKRKKDNGKGKSLKEENHGK